MADILLTTLNARFIHAAFGLRYLHANLDELQPRAEVIEFDINQRTLDIVEAILARSPRIVGFGVYIWNTTETAAVITALKRIEPGLIVILGGPEVSHELTGQAVVGLADHVITGEADLEFAAVCRQLLAGGHPPAVIAAKLPDFSQLRLPYELYSDADLAHRVLYVEASRGCPFSCEFCLSSLEIPVRAVPLPAFLAAMDRLLERGARQFKFVDRTFNLHLPTARAILEWCLERCQPGRFFHFEMVPDRLPEALREIIARFPPGALQFEVGIQTFDPAVGQLISRRQDYGRLEANLRWLRANSGVHVHADLIVGLPGEDMASFGAGFDRLIALGPQEIQVGMLKRLRGTPIIRHDEAWGMTYHQLPPYEILQTRLIPFATMQRLRRFAKYWDLLGNSGNFVGGTPLLWAEETSPFEAFLQFSDWLHTQTGRADGMALLRVLELLFRYLTVVRGRDPAVVAPVLWRDYQRGGRRDKPGFLAPHLAGLRPDSWTAEGGLPPRQSRHLRSDPPVPVPRGVAPGAPERDKVRDEGEKNR